MCATHTGTKKGRASIIGGESEQSTHTLRWPQGLEAMGVAMSRCLAQLLVCEHKMACGHGGWMDASAAQGAHDAPCATSEASQVGSLSIQQCCDVLLGFTLAASDDSLSSAPVMWGMLEAALLAAKRQYEFLQRFASAHLIVEVLWSVCVVQRVNHDAHLAPALNAQVVALQAHLLLILAKRWCAGVLSFSPSAPDAPLTSDASSTSHTMTLQPETAVFVGASEPPVVGVVQQVLHRVHAQMLVQVVLGADSAALQHQQLDAFSKHVKQLARNADAVRLSRHATMLDDMYQVLQGMHAGARRAVELGDGGCLVALMLPVADASCQDDAQLDRQVDGHLDSSPSLSYSASYSASTEMGTRTSCMPSPRVVCSGTKEHSDLCRSLSNSMDLEQLAAATGAGRLAVAGVNCQVVIEVYDARRDCLHLPSHLGVPFKPGGVWQERMRLLRRRGFTVLQVGTEQWAAFLDDKPQVGCRLEGRMVGATSACSGESNVGAGGRWSRRGEWLMRLINTAFWVASLLLFPSGLEQAWGTETSEMDTETSERMDTETSEVMQSSQISHPLHTSQLRDTSQLLTQNTTASERADDRHVLWQPGDCEMLRQGGDCEMLRQGAMLLQEQELLVHASPHTPHQVDQDDTKGQAVDGAAQEESGQAVNGPLHAAVDEFALGETASSWLAASTHGYTALAATRSQQHSGASRQPSDEQGKGGGKVWMLFWSKNKHKWFYFNRRSKNKVWEPPPVQGWVIKKRPPLRTSVGAAACDEAYPGLSHSYYNELTQESSLEPPAPAV